MARSEGGPNLEEDKSVKGRKKIRDEGPRVLMGFVARPERANIPPKRRNQRPERTVGLYLPELTRQDAFAEDMPPGENEEWPGGNWRLSQSQALSNMNARWEGDGGTQEMGRVVLCCPEVPAIMNEENDPEGWQRAFHIARGVHSKWTHPNRFWDGFELFDKETPIRKGGDPTITEGHREGNDTMRIFFRGFWTTYIHHSRSNQLG